MHVLDQRHPSTLVQYPSDLIETLINVETLSVLSVPAFPKTTPYMTEGNSCSVMAPSPQPMRSRAVGGSAY